MRSVVAVISFLAILQRVPPSAGQGNFIVNNSTIGVCICVTSGSCALSGGTSSSTDGSGSIDVRIINVSLSQLLHVGQ